MSKPKLNPERGEAWGVLGGSFDPIHNGHLNLASEIGAIKKLTGILLVPTSKHPIKNHPCLAGLDHRLKMIELATKETDNLFVCDIEKCHELSGYSFDTIAALKKRYPEVKFSFIIGVDNLNLLDQWHRIDDLVNEVTFLVGSRSTSDVSKREAVSKYPLEFVPTSLIEVSSSDVRAMLARKAPTGQLQTMVPASVLDYIDRNGIYR